MEEFLTLGIVSTRDIYSGYMYIYIFFVRKLQWL